MRNLSTALFEKEKITTTLAKAKELRRFAEKLVTLSKKESLHARRQVLRQIHDRRIVAKLFDTLSARYTQRPGGYTRIIKLGPRQGDHAEMAVIELVASETAATPETVEKGEKGKKAKRSPAASKKARTTAAPKAKKAATTEAAPKKKTTRKKTASKAKASSADSKTSARKKAPAKASKKAGTKKKA